MKEVFEPPFLRWFKKIYIEDVNRDYSHLDTWNQVFDKFYQENFNPNLNFKKLFNSIGQYYGFWNFEVIKYELNLILFPLNVLEDKRETQEWFYDHYEPFDFLQELKSQKRNSILEQLKMNNTLSKRFHEICLSWR